MRPEISKRAKNIQSSPIRKLYPLAKRAEAKGKTVLYVNIGQPDIATPQQALSRVKNIPDEILAYSPSTGFVSLKEKISAYMDSYNISISPEHIAITTGGSEAVFFAIAATCDAGDNILIPEPFYANYKSFAQMLGVEINPIPTTIEKGFHIPSPEEIERRINDRTRAILICNPSNPTGTVYTEKEIEWVVEISEKNNLFIISDEVYREFRYGNTPFISPMHFDEASERTIITDSISKRFSSCGARIGFLISKNSSIMEAVEKFSMARLSPPTLEQYLAEEEFLLPEEYYREIVMEYETRKDAFIKELSGEKGITLPNPEGAFYIIVRLEGVNSENFAKFLLEDFSLNGVTAMVAPAGGFYQTKGAGLDEIRVAFVLNASKMLLAGRIIKQGYWEFIQKNKQA